MNDDFEIIGDSAQEARIVAVVLGEASDFEREEVDRLCEENAELQIFRRRMEAVHGLIGKSRAENPESKSNKWTLSKERRARVLEKLGEKETVVAIPKKKPLVRPIVWQIAACAAVMVIVVGVLAPTQLRTVTLSHGEYSTDQATSQNEQSISHRDTSLTQLRAERKELKTAEALPGLVMKSESIERMSRAQTVSRQPSAPSSAMAKVLAEASAEPTAIPVPEIEVPLKVTKYGESEVFGFGWQEGQELAEKDVNESAPQETGADAFAPRQSVTGTMGGFTEEDPALGFGLVDAGVEMEQSLTQDKEEVNDSVIFADTADESVNQGKAVHTESNDLLAQVKQQEKKVRALTLQKQSLERNSNEAELVELATEMHDYKEATREYENSLALLQQLKLAHSSERVGLRLPREPVAVPGNTVLPKKSVEVEQREGIDLLGIRPKSKNATEAVEITKGVAEANQEGWNREEVKRAERRLAELDDEIERQKDKVEAKRKVLDTIVRITGRPYFEGSDSRPESMETRLRMMAEKNSFEMKKNRDQYKIYLEKLEDLEGTQLFRYAAELPVDDNRVRPFHAKYLSAKREREAKKAAGFGESHPELLAEATRLEESEKDLEQAVVALRESLETNYEMLSEQLLVMEATESESQSQAAFDEHIRGEKAKLEALQKKLEAERLAKEAALRTKQGEVLNEKDAQTHGDSTFSLHVSDVSFKLAKSALEQGKWPEAVRVEEFVNAFSYREQPLISNEPVGLSMEQAAHPFLSQRNLLRVSLQTAATGRGAGVPLRLTVVLDKSGSMERVDRATAVEEAFRVLVEQLMPGDKVTLVGFSRRATLLADLVDGSEGERLLEILRKTPSEGGTNVEEALNLAFAKAAEHYQDNAQNRVILLTDGIANLGDAVPDSLMKIVTRMREEGLAFDACGVGVEGVNDKILEALTRKGDGRYYLLGSAAESGSDFAKQVAGALRPAARNVKVQVEWNPDRVGKWRLYGFENHELEKEDFRNDAVDAAEMAAEEEGVALYHVEVKPDGDGPLGVARVRFQDVASDEMVEREWEIAYEGEAAALNEADAKIRLAGVAGLAAEKLAQSALGERVDWDELLQTTRQLQSVFPKQQQVRDLESMIEQAKGLE